MDATRIAALGMQQDLRRMDAVSQNLANVLTVGYKKQVAQSDGVFGALVTSGAAASSQTSGTGNVIDLTHGTLRHTANPRDVAIEGVGFFEVATSSGPQYTRQGNLRVDLSGRLVGEHGFPILGEGGEIILNDTPFSIDASGNVQQAGRQAGRLKLVQFDNSSAMVPLGAGLYGQGGARATAVKLERPVIRAGFLENSNVSSPQEMVRLSEIVRHFESMQKIMQGYDESLEKTLRKLGDF